MVASLFKEQRTLIEHFFEKIDLIKTAEILERFFSCRGTLIFTGVGKSGIIANKLAMTMLSTGTKALYISSADALHGDMGMVSKDDLFICLSKSGETKELLDLIPYVRKKGAFLVALVSNPDSKLAKLADLSINLPLKKELCPFNLAPTTSTTLQLIFGDILAVALMQKKAFSLDEYALNHPSGSIGKKIVLKVCDLMLKGPALPICFEEDLLIDVLPVLSSKKCGALLVIDRQNVLKGLFTDGDLRRALEFSGKQALDLPMQKLMVSNFKWIKEDVLAVKALEKMEEDPKKLITVLPVLAEDKTVKGLIRLHDILQAGLKS